MTHNYDYLTTSIMATPPAHGGEPEENNRRGERGGYVDHTYVQKANLAA